MFPQASARTRPVYGTTCSRRESCAYLQQNPSRKPESQLYQCLIPLPVFAEVLITSIDGLRRLAYCVHASESKSTYGNKSIFVTIIKSDEAKIFGYFRGLSSPSVTESITTLFPSPRSKSAGHTRFPTFSTKRIPPSSRVKVSSACPNIFASR